MTMTPKLWEIIIKAFVSMQECPSWLKVQASLTWEAASQLPVLDLTKDGQPARPTVEKKVVTPEYLDFLREQIELDTRGPEWIAVLRTRLAALEPFVGKELVTATLHSRPHSATLRICCETGATVHAEVI